MKKKGLVQTMKILKCMLVVVIIVLVACAGIYLGKDTKETEQIEEAVMI